MLNVANARIWRGRRGSVLRPDGAVASLDGGSVIEKAFLLRIDGLRLSLGAKLAVIGPSGAGKSTALDFLALLSRPEALGDYRLRLPRGEWDFTEMLRAGHLDGLAPLRADVIGYVMQFGGLAPFVNARENILLSWRAAGRGSVDKARLDNLVGKLALNGAIQKQRAELSGGERKRIAIARALYPRPPIVLADEPTAGLDAGHAEIVMKILSDYADEGDAICIIATHDVEIARAHGFVITKMTRIERGGIGEGVLNHV